MNVNANVTVAFEFLKCEPIGYYEVCLFQDERMEVLVGLRERTPSKS